MIFLPLLTATVFAVGGPRPHHPQPPSIFAQATVHIYDSHRQEVATSAFGNIALRVLPGFYRLTASYTTNAGTNTVPCSSAIVYVGAKHRNVPVRLGCSIK